MTIETHSKTIETVSKSPGIYLRSNILQKKSSYYDTSISIAHWQLKDLVCKSSTSNSVYFPLDNKVYNLDFNENNKYSDTYDNNSSSESINKKKKHRHSNNVHLNPKLSDPIRFSNSPKCIKESDNIIVVGGLSNLEVNSKSKWKGLFGIHFKNLNITNNLNIGILVNNSVSIDKIHNSYYKSFVCNNDQHLYALDILNNGIVNEPGDSIDLGVALNHSELSMDRKTLITVGDTSNIFIMHLDQGLQRKDIISTKSDCGFSTSWKSTGIQFSTCFQDGTNYIYDIRNLSHPLHEIHSTRPAQQNGAFRVVKFSQLYEDLLFISEQQSRIHMIDTRNFSSHQIIMLPKTLYDESDGYYNQPIVKPYEEIIDSTNKFGNLSASNYSRYDDSGHVVNKIVDMNQVKLTDAFNYSSLDCPVRYPSNNIADKEQIISQPLYPEDYIRTTTSTRSPLSMVLSPESIQDKINSPFTDPFYYMDSELEICGLNLIRANGSTSLCIGTQKGIINWKIDGWKRRCFPSFEYS